MNSKRNEESINESDESYCPFCGRPESELRGFLLNDRNDNGFAGIDCPHCLKRRKYFVKKLTDTLSRKPEIRKQLKVQSTKVKEPIKNIS